MRHPNIVLVMGISVVDVVTLPLTSKFSKQVVSEAKTKKQSTICIITEYLEQGSLADILYGPTRLPPEIWTYELVLTCALQAARGMLYLHSYQPPICHRDLKSSNLVVDDHWVVKVTDFGMSRIVPDQMDNIDKIVRNKDNTTGKTNEQKDLEERESGESMGSKSNVEFEIYTTSDQSITRSGNIAASNLEMTSNLGTTAWCAPELFTASTTAQYSVKVDVYSFGIVLWELWERKKPFEEYISKFDIMDAVKSGKRPIISDNCPPTYRSLIQRCWQTQPSRRPMFKYITRYLKEELAQVRRQRSNSGAYNETVYKSLFHNMFSFVNRPQASFRDSNFSEGNSTFIIHDTKTKVENPLLLPRDTITSINGSEYDRKTNDEETNTTSLHENRSALLAAFDRGLTHLVDNEDEGKPPSIMNMYASNNKINTPAVTIKDNKNNKQWRDKYVMKFSGCNQFI